MPPSRFDEGQMSNDLPSPDLPSVAIGYANPVELPRRPGLLTALGITDFLIAPVSVLFNVAAIVSCIFVYRLTLPVPAPKPAIVMLTPTTPVTPYHGDYLPPNGLPQASRATIVNAITKSRSLNHDRQEMLHRLLAECGKQIFPNFAPSDIAASLAGAPAASKNLGPLPPDVFRFTTGRVEIDNCNASFRPADDGPPTVITGNFVAVAGKTQFCAVAVDQAVDAAQRNLKGGMNSLQAGALAELYRPDGAGLKPSNLPLTPNFRYVSQLQGSQT